MTRNILQLHVSNVTNLKSYKHLSYFIYFNSTILNSYVIISKYYKSHVIISKNKKVTNLNKTNVKSARMQYKKIPFCLLGVTIFQFNYFHGKKRKSFIVIFNLLIFGNHL